MTVNGRAVHGEPTPGGYFPVARTWRAGDTVHVSIPFRLRVEKALDDASLQTLFLGPVNLVARDAATEYLEFGLHRNAALSGDLLPSLTPVPGEPLHFRLDGVEPAPFFEGTDDPTHVCFRRSEPRIAFGGTDSGVANPTKKAGTTLLDEIWAGAPFRGKGALVSRVRASVAAWVSAGLLDRADGAKVVATAEQAAFAA